MSEAINQARLNVGDPPETCWGYAMNLADETERVLREQIADKIEALPQWADDPWGPPVLEKTGEWLERARVLAVIKRMSNGS